MHSQESTVNISNKLIPPSEASELLGVTPGTLQVWRSTARYNLPYVKVGKKVMYSMPAVLKFIENQTRKHTGIGGDSVNN